ncbi:MAG: GTP cyclohydrolase II [Rhodospirillaceae bacterium]|nr:GTP cyclohydrolase II [Rhodospirillaceae bacterium]|tara:strand:+ start:70 stop:1212 length:1143 start_codon:yes stop_codon:yes gene_type:complete
MNKKYKKDNSADTYDVLEELHRAISDIRRGSPIVISDAQTSILVCAAEIADSAFSRLTKYPNIGKISLAMTGRRASILGLGPSDSAVAVITQQQPINIDIVTELINSSKIHKESNLTKMLTAISKPSSSLEHAAVYLTKKARLLPAVIFSEITSKNGQHWAQHNRRTHITAESVFEYDTTAANTLEAISEAPIPLENSEHTRIIAFRSKTGGSEHIAIVVGNLNAGEPTLTRIHSECFTGDLLGSLKCDCGDQLRGAIKLIAEHKNGVLLYLDQEGRGIGLINKLRAYKLQEDGFDTIDANEQLGFENDERIYIPAAEILKKLGVKKIKLLTNNPSKVSALARHGITITERVPHVFPANKHNFSYLQTKADRAGHIIRDS